MSFRTQGRVDVEPLSVADILHECVATSPRAWQSDVVDDIEDKVFDADGVDANDGKQVVEPPKVVDGEQVVEVDRSVCVDVGDVCLAEDEVRQNIFFGLMVQKRVAAFIRLGT
jgi:hypothetical protein